MSEPITSQKYFLIENLGEAELPALTLMGASSKRDAGDKIGLFGTGFKNALAVLLRENINVIIFFGDKRIGVETKPVEFRGKQFKQVELVLDDRRIETGFTTDMGLRWSVDGALRDLVSNALDEQNPLVVKWDESPSGMAGRTRVFIEYAKPVEDFHGLIAKHFLKLRDTKPKFTFDGGELWPKFDSAKTRFYRHGVLVYESEKTGCFDYDISSISITEERTATEFEVMWQFGHHVDRFPKAAKIEIVAGLSYERFESLCDHIKSFSSPDWKDILGDKIACNAVVCDGPLNIYFPKGRVQRCNEKWEHALGSAGCETSATFLSYVHKAGGNIVKPTDREELGICWAVDFVKRSGFVVERDQIDVFIAENTFKMGEYDREKNRILISKNCLEKGRHYLVSTLMEEVFHRDSGMSDYTREFQTYILDKFASKLAESLNEYF